MNITDPKFNPSGDPTITGIKERAVALGQYIEDNVLVGRRRSVAMTKLEEASMWAVKAAACGDN